MPRVILVGGGSASGKSYVTREVISRVGREHISRITIDDYYKDQTNIPMEERVKVNYDHPKAFDWQLIRTQIQALKEGKSIEKPIYDFTIHNRKKETETIVPGDLIVVEGIMALVDKKLRELGDLKVFIYASHERRFLRRIIRDHQERKRSFESIVNQYFSSVQPMFEEIVAPSATYADVIVNNDGVKNLSIDVLTCAFKEELEKAMVGNQKSTIPENEFAEEVLESVFTQG